MKNKSTLKLIALIAVVVALIITAACTIKPRETNEQVVVPPVTSEYEDVTVAPTTGSNNAKLVTIEELKAEFGDTKYSSKYAFKPFYNVEQTTEFTFRFKSSVDPIKAVTVHTDSKCEDASTVYQLNDGYKTATGVDVVVKPGKPVLGSTNRSDYKDGNYWGFSPIYYLCVRYDLDSTTVKKLDEPIVIPFTVKNKISTPTAYANITKDGTFTVEWLPVDGATSYRIYSVMAPDSKVREYTREEVAYTADAGKMKLVTTVDAKKNSFVNETSYPNNAYTRNAKSSYSIDFDYTTSQNWDSLRTYYVTAIDSNGNESFFSKAITDWNLQDVLPSKLKNSFIGAITEFPDTVKVVMLDGKTTMDFPINFRRAEEPKEYSTQVKYIYEIPGTLLSGLVDYKNEEKIFPNEHKSTYTSNTGAFYKEHLPEIAPVTVPQVVDNDYSNNSINLLDRASYPDEAKIKLDQAALLRRMDMESARIITDGLYSRPLDSIESYVASDNPEYIVVRKNGALMMVKADEYESTSQGNSEGGNAIYEEPPVEQENPAIEEPPVDTPPALPTEPVPEENNPITETTPVEPEVEVVEIPDQPQEDINNNNYVEVQKESTKKDVEEGNKETIATTDYPIVAKTAGQKYLALSLINHDEDVSLKAFPEYQDLNELFDDLLYVWYQNPYIMTLNTPKLAYNYETQTLKVAYGVDSTNTKKYQEAVYNKSKEVANQIIKPGMSDYEKSVAIFEYLEKSASYNHDALDYAMAGNKDVYEKYPNSWNTYGILCENLGVCQSYAYAYNAIAQQAGLDTMMVTGFLQNGGHAWNACKINGNWYTVDPTSNNKDGKSVPYWVVNTSYDFAKGNTFVIDEGFVDGPLTATNNPLSSDNSQDWYTKNNLYAKNMAELAKIVKDNYNPNSMLFIKCDPSITISTQGEANRFGTEFVNAGGNIEYLQDMRFGQICYGCYMFVSQKLVSN